MTPLNDATSPRLRALLGPVLLWQLFELAAYGLLASRVTLALRRSGIESFPDAPQRLFSDGGLWLLELLHQQRSNLLAGAHSVAFLLALFVCLELLPQWWLLRSLCVRHRILPRAVRPVLAQLGVSTLALWMLRAMSLLPLLLLGLLPAGFTVQLDARLVDLALLSALGLWLALQLVLSVLHDLLAVRIVASSRSPRGVLRWALSALSARGGRLTLRCGAYRALALGTIIGGELLLLALPGAALTWAGVSFAVHQSALFARLLLRGLWLRELVEAEPG